MDKKKKILKFRISYFIVTKCCLSLKTQGKNGSVSFNDKKIEQIKTKQVRVSAKQNIKQTETSEQISCQPENKYSHRCGETGTRGLY